jgi:hypothetical protein
VPTTVDADLCFVLEREGAAPVTGHLTGAANRLRLEVSDPGAFAGSDDASVVRALAAGLAQRGLTVEVHHDDHLLVTLGRVRVPWWQRVATRSRHLRVGSLRGAWTSARSRATSRGPALPGSSMLPPTTLWPIAPTFARRVRRRPTTTHDPSGGGLPRLVLEKEHLWAGERQPIFWLGDGTTTIGSGPDCDVRLPGLEAEHAVVHRTDDDEFVVEPVAGDTHVHGARYGGRIVLRTGARIEVGPHVLAYFREEYADHGRPYGGRIGGELGRQLPQERKGTGF